MRFSTPTASRRKREAGFTLAEVLAALFFMALVIPVAVETLHVASRAGSTAQRKDEAARIAQAVLNEGVLTGNWGQSTQGTVQRKGCEYRWQLHNETWRMDSMQLVTGRSYIFCGWSRKLRASEHIGEFHQRHLFNRVHSLGWLSALDRVGEPAAAMNMLFSTRHARSGFTLMEVVLAVGVCVVALSAVTAVFFGAVRLRETTLQAVGESLPVQQALDVMERDLKGAMAPTTNGVYSGVASGNLTGIFSGDFRVGSLNSPGVSQTVSIELYTTTGVLRDNQPWGDVQRVTYGLQPSRSGQNLVRSVTRDVLATFIPTPENQVLLENVAGLNIDCLGP